MCADASSSDDYDDKYDDYDDYDDDDDYDDEYVDGFMILVVDLILPAMTSTTMTMMTTTTMMMTSARVLLSCYNLILDVAWS